MSLNLTLIPPLGYALHLKDSSMRGMFRTGHHASDHDPANGIGVACHLARAKRLLQEHRLTCSTLPRGDSKLTNKAHDRETEAFSPNHHHCLGC